ncbi:MAG TPA: T9SS type A sorting domain-containing protein, partial [Phaeodactylibacter sp.]|nr:T9SS type A sorting domain-containing protein [Phaeodactylibacter sp.]
EQADPNSIPHNLIVRGNYLYVSYYYDGLQVYDISDPANPVRAYYYDTSTLPNEQSYKGAWGVYPFLPSGNILVSDMQNGLFVVEAVEMPTGSVSTPDAGISLSLFPQPANEYLAVNIQVEKATQNTSLQLLDLTGRQVWAKELSLLQGENNIRIEEIYSLPAGCYLLNVKGDTWQLTERLIISR